MSDEKPRHTPGPWEDNDVYPEMKSYNYHIYPSFDSSIVIAQVYGRTPEEAKANGALIKSAPQLAEENAKLREDLFKERSYTWELTSLRKERDDLKQINAELLENRTRALVAFGALVKLKNPSDITEAAKKFLSDFDQIVSAINKSQTI